MSRTRRRFTCWPEVSLNWSEDCADVISRKMNADETAVFKLLQEHPDAFVAVVEISRRLGARRKFQKDRTWARPILRRMELDGLLETNEYGDYRIKAESNWTGAFKSALNKPGASLGDTTIISLDEARAMDEKDGEDESNVGTG